MATKRKALGELSSNVPSKAPRTAKTDTSALSTQDTTLNLTPVSPPPLPPQRQLLVMAASQEAVAGFVTMLAGNSAGSISTNQSLPPVARLLTDSDLAFPQEPQHGHCKALYTRTRQAGGEVVERLKLREGGENSDSPRTNLLQGVASKVYIYHILAAHRAYTSPSSSLNPACMRRICRDKRSEEPLTVLHLCGNKWCMNGDHLSIGSKRLNDEQTACHRGLQSGATAEDMAAVQQGYCRHPTKCWTNVYGGAFRPEHGWAVE